MPGTRRFFTLFLLFISMSLAQESGWNICSKMPLPVYGGKAVAHDSLIYIIGGISDSVYTATNLIQAYDPAGDSWRIMRYGLQSPRHGFVADIYRDELLILGGSSMSDSRTSSMERWNFRDPPEVTDTNLYFNRTFATGLVYEDIFYIFGGYPDYRFTEDSLDIPYLYGYHIPSGTISYTNVNLFPIYSLDGSFPYHQMSVLFNDNIYVFGGALNGVLIDIYRFGSVDREWNSVIPSLLEERAGAEALKANDKSVIIIGGYNESARALSTTEFYFPEDHYSARGPDLNFARKELMAAIFNKKIYVFGGRDENGKTVPFVECLASPETTALQPLPVSSPVSFELLKNYPDPFNPVTTIKIVNHRSQWVTLEIFDITGSAISTLHDGELDPGEHSFRWEGKDQYGKPVSSGVYFYRARTTHTRSSNRMILMR